MSSFFSLSLFVLVDALATLFVLGTASALPDPVASHFGRGGRPNGWMSRDAYVLLSVPLTCIIPMAIVAVVALLARRAPHLINMPNRDYWFVPERRKATISSLVSRALWLGTLVALFMAAMHWVILAANEVPPPRLPAPFFWLFVGIFLTSIGLWALLFYARFRRPRE